MFQICVKIVCINYLDFIAARNGMPMGGICIDKIGEGGVLGPMLTFQFFI